MSTGNFCRVLGVLGHGLELSTDDAGIARQLEQVLVDVPESHEDATAQLILERVDSNSLILTGPTPWSGPTSEKDAITRVVTAVNRLALDLSVDRLCIHAAGIELGGGTHGLVGKSGVGKTTALIDLMRSGAVALNDEMLCVHGPSLKTSSWPKPLSVKPGVHDQEFASLLTNRLTGRFDSVPLSRVGSYTLAPEPLASLVFLRRSSRTSVPQIDLLTPADALVALGDHLMNFRSFGAPTALSTMASAVSKCATWALDLGDPALTPDAIMRSVQDVGRNSVDWSIVESLEPPVVRGCRTVILGSEVAVWSPASEHLVALGDSAAEMWMDLVRGDSDRLLEYSTFSQSLVDHGLLDFDETLDVPGRQVGVSRLIGG